MLPLACVHAYVQTPYVLPEATGRVRKKKKEEPQCSPSPVAPDEEVLGGSKALYF